MDFKEFETLIKKINTNKYHISRTLRFKEDGTPYIDNWAIFRKNMTIEEYFNPKNLAILSSDNNNTLEDIEKFIKEENNELI